MEYEKLTVPERPIRYKFLKKRVSIWDQNLKALTYTKLKNVYLQRIHEKYCPVSNKYYSKGKSSNYLKSLHLTVASSPHCINIAKNAKNLKTVDIGIPNNNDTSLAVITAFLKRLPKKVEVISVGGRHNNPNEARLRNFYRTLGTFKNLRRITKSLLYSDKDIAECNWVKKEFYLINQYISKIKNIEFNLTQRSSNQHNFQEFMKLDQICSSVKKLTFSLDDEMFKIREADDDDEDDDQFDDDHVMSGLENNDDDDEDLYENNSQDYVSTSNERNSKIAPFFKFHLFPNLRNLDLSIFGDLAYPLYPFVAKGFEHLQKLEALSLTIEIRPKGTKFLIDGLLHLPLLKSFNLEIPHLKSQERTLFAQFLQKQTKLVYLRLSIERYKTTKTEYLEQNQYLENLYGCLSNKPYLKVLTLQFHDWALEKLSNGLKDMNMENQLEHLTIEVLDDFELSSTNPSARVEGLCEFIKQHKLSLHNLSINIQLVTNDVIVNSLVKTISDLENLKALSLCINSGRSYLQEYGNYCKTVYSKSVSEESLAGLPYSTKTFSYFEQALRKLNNLVDLNIHLNTVLNKDQIPNGKSTLVLDALPTLKSLKRFWLELPFAEEEIGTCFMLTVKQLNLKNITEINVRDSQNGKIKEIEKVLESFRPFYELNKYLKHH